jgi:hypothetical protein
MRRALAPLVVIALVVPSTLATAQTSPERSRAAGAALGLVLRSTQAPGLDRAIEAAGLQRDPGSEYALAPQAYVGAGVLRFGLRGEFGLHAPGAGGASDVDLQRWSVGPELGVEAFRVGPLRAELVGGIAYSRTSVELDPRTGPLLVEAQRGLDDRLRLRQGAGLVHAGFALGALLSFAERARPSRTGTSSRDGVLFRAMGGWDWSFASGEWSSEVRNLGAGIDAGASGPRFELAVALHTEQRTVVSCEARCGARPNAVAACTSERCEFECQTGWADCNGRADDGCERALTTLTDCGACGATCKLAHARATCALGYCEVASCDAGFASCNGAAFDGCERALPDGEACSR